MIGLVALVLAVSLEFMTDIINSVAVLFEASRTMGSRDEELSGAVWFLESVMTRYPRQLPLSYDYSDVSVERSVQLQHKLTMMLIVP